MPNLPRTWLIPALCIAVLSLILTPLEYGSFRFKTVMYPALWITIGVIGIRLIQDKRNRHLIVKLIIAFSIYILLTLFFLFRLTFCKTGNERIWYVHKENASISLICRSFECYQTTGPCTLYKSYKIIGKLKWTIKFSDDIVDTSRWRKANQIIIKRH
jgi:hypothetical protein